MLTGEAKRVLVTELPQRGRGRASVAVGFCGKASIGW